MQVNRVLLDILNWVKQLVWWREHKIAVQPYEVISRERTLFGILKKVTRDTPRALSTYIFTPLAPPRYSKDKHYDYHLCLDHLWSLDSAHKEIAGKLPRDYNLRYNHRHTHCVTILQAGRWVNSSGSYYSKVLYQGYFDFMGSYSPYEQRDRWAYAIFADLARALKLKEISLVDFTHEIETARTKFLGKGASKVESNCYSYTEK